LYKKEQTLATAEQIMNSSQLEQILVPEEQKNGKEEQNLRTSEQIMNSSQTIETTF
jgi:hypothetical protein